MKELKRVLSYCAALMLMCQAVYGTNRVAIFLSSALLIMVVNMLESFATDDEFYHKARRMSKSELAKWFLDQYKKPKKPLTSQEISDVIRFSKTQIYRKIAVKE